MISFKICKIILSFEFGFFAAVTLFCLLDAPELALSAVCAAAIHEGGHIFAAFLCDMNIKKITFWAGGIRIETEGKIKSLSKDIFILISGPAFNFIAALFYFRTECYSPFSVNIILGLFNLLPFSTLDGGAILKKSLEHLNIFSDMPLKFIAFTAAISVIAFFYTTDTGSFTGYLTIIFLLICEIISLIFKND